MSTHFREEPNTFTMVDRVRANGRQIVVLKSLRAGQIRKAYCNTDKLSAVKLAKVYLSGLAHEVWTPDETTRERREVFFTHRRTVKDTTLGRNRIRSWLTDHGVRAPQGLRLTQPSGRDWALSSREWTATQRLIIDSHPSQYEPHPRPRKACFSDCLSPFAPFAFPHSLFALVAPGSCLQFIRFRPIRPRRDP